MTTIENPVAPTAKGEPIYALHGLRFLAAFSILILHSFGWIGAFSNSSVFAYVGNVFGIFGMPLFFVLSGFVIHYNYARLFSEVRFSWAVVEFGAARFARLFPLYIFFQLIGITLDQMLGWLGTDLKGSLLLFLGHAGTLTHSWFYIILNNREIINNGFGVSWSISTEMFFYLTFPLIVLPIFLARTWRQALVLLLVYAVVAQILFIEAYMWRDYWNYWGAKILPATMADAGNSVERFLFYYSPWGRIFEFIIGCLTAHLFMKLANKPPGPTETKIGGGLLVIVSAILIYLAWSMVRPASSGLGAMMHYNTDRAFGMAIPIAILIFCVSRYRTSFSRLLSAGPMVLLGEMSYSIYANHYFILRPFFVGQPEKSLNLYSGLIAVCSIALGIILTLVVSYGTYRVIEVPARRWIRNLSHDWLVDRWGSRDENLLEVEERTSPRLGMVSLGLVALVAVLAACAWYQFVAVGWLKPWVTHLS